MGIFSIMWTEVLPFWGMTIFSDILHWSDIIPNHILVAELNTAEFRELSTENLRRVYVACWQGTLSPPGTCFHSILGLHLLHLLRLIFFPFCHGFRTLKFEYILVLSFIHLANELTRKQCKSWVILMTDRIRKTYLLKVWAITYFSYVWITLLT